MLPHAPGRVGGPSWQQSETWEWDPPPGSLEEAPGGFQTQEYGTVGLEAESQRVFSPP